jgi:D-3-phosphoglycerate dehydrogenase / 2-oxoglutarate reductase
MPKPLVVYCGSNEVPVELIKGILKEIDAELVLANPKTDEEVAQAGKQADGMIFHGAIPLSRETLFALERCKIICRTGVGVDRMDLQAAAERNIIISNAAGCNSIEVAEHTIGLLLTMARKIVRMNTYVREGRWKRHSAELHAYRGEVLRVTGQTIGIVGLGHVGRQVAPRAKGIGLKVQAHDPYMDAKTAASLGVELVPLNDLLRTSDFVTLHAPLYRETRHMINAESLKLLKPTAYLINAARGPLVDTDALLAALKEGRLGGAWAGVPHPQALPAGRDRPRAAAGRPSHPPAG